MHTQIPVKIENNFMVVSSFNNDLNWINSRTDNYFIYERGSQDCSDYGLNALKCFKSPNVGYNIYDYLTYIIDNYYELPSCLLFVKGNIFPRHISEEYFDKISNINIFMPIIDQIRHKTSWPMSVIINDTTFLELNTNWYLNHHPVKYFHSFNDFLSFAFVNPLLPRYINFAPGANYIVPRQNILRIPRIFYENLRTFISYTTLPGEAHIMERALSTIWTTSYIISNNMLDKIDQLNDLPVFPQRRRTWRDYMDAVEYRMMRTGGHLLKFLHFW